MDNKFLYVIAKNKYGDLNFDELETQIKKGGLEYNRNDYGIFFKGEDHDIVTGYVKEMEGGDSD